MGPSPMLRRCDSLPDKLELGGDEVKSAQEAELEACQWMGAGQKSWEELGVVLRDHIRVEAAQGDHS